MQPDRGAVTLFQRREPVGVIQVVVSGRAGRHRRPAEFAQQGFELIDIRQLRIDDQRLASLRQDQVTVGAELVQPGSTPRAPQFRKRGGR